MRRGFHSSLRLAAPLISTRSTRRHFPHADGHQCGGAAALFTFIRRLSTSVDEDGGEPFTRLFNERPVAERAVAMSIARRHSDTAVPLKTFVEELPKVTRDEVFGRGMRVEDWVKESPLLSIVEDANGMRSVRLTGRAASLVEDSDYFYEKNNGNTTNTEAEVTGKSKAESAKDAAVTEKLIVILRLRVLSPEKGNNRGDNKGPHYLALNEAFTSLLRETSGREVPEMVRNAASALNYAQFLNLLQSPRGREEFWVLNEKYVCVRGPGETQPPRFVSPQPRTFSASSLNNYGGWGAASNVPTRQDVYEILKYIPVNWGNFGNINLPPAVKKKHIRISSVLMWFRRQPYYFELRSVSGTTEIRRSVTLHPEAHGLTPEEAHERLQLMIAKGEANSLIPVGVDGGVVSSDDSLQTAGIVKFASRVCPGYFVTPSLIMQRYTKKSLTSRELVSCMQGRTSEFEVIQSKYSDTPLIRKRVGADSSRWKKDFTEDLEQFPEDARGLIILMGRVCSTWDRPQYVYVRLTDEEKSILGGYDGMMKILQRHPHVFRSGKTFIARADLSDPLSLREPEPNPDDMTTRVIIRDENPYQTPHELAVVFHYVAPDDEPSTASFFVQCSSPAMRAVLPPRIVTVLQLFPRLFVCKETAPGVFSIRKVKQNAKRRPEFGNSNPQLVMQKEVRGATVDDQGGDTDESFDADFIENDILSPEETIQSVKALIPPNGVEASQLLLWASIGVQQAASHHYGGILKLVESNRAHFRVQESQETKMIYIKEG